MMNTLLTITLSPEELQQLNDAAQRLQMTPEELIQLSVKSFLRRPNHSFQDAAEYVLRKNNELYKRLA